ncbi:MAG TPA: DUF2298 domain-containing protein [Roseiflexaceae bacterium]
MTSNRASEDTPTSPAQPAGVNRRLPWLSWVVLAAIVALGAYFSTLNLFGWDGDTGQHPDERFMTLVADRLKMPASLGEYLDSARNPLNPRNSGNTFYVYGLLPQTLTHISAAMLTPEDALPPMVRAASPGSYDSAPLIPNPDLNVPKIGPLQALLNPVGVDLTSYYFVPRVGRAWSALFEILSVVVVFLIGRRLYGSRVGMLAALFLALSALPIQIAHFFTVDSATAFFTLLSVYWVVRVAQGGRVGSAVALGISIGAAMACRITMASLGLLAILAVALRIWEALAPQQERQGDRATGRRGDDLPPAPSPLRPFAGFGLLALAGVVTIVSFRLLQPDAFLGTSFFDLRPDPRFIDNITTIGGYVSGALDSPPSQQWAGRTPFLFPLQNMILWGMGLPLGLAAWIAWAAAGVQMARAAWAGWSGAGWQLLRQRLVHLLPWSWIAFYFAWQGGQFGMTMRYYLLLYGLLALFAAWGLIRIADCRLQIADWAQKKSTIYNLQSAIRWVPLLVVVAGTLCWAYAFTRIYTRPHSRITASRWIYEHIPAGSTLTAEQWDDTLPLSIDGRRAFRDPGSPQSDGFYYNVQMFPYAEDDQTKYTGYIGQDGKFVPGLFDQLDQADYIVLSSNRVYGSATRMPMRYPALTRYYHYLFSGELGFEQVADIASYPTLFGIPIPDQGAEEAFSVYDHPRVLVFHKTEAYTRARAEQLIAGGVAWDEVYKLSTLRASKAPTALRLTESQWPAYRAAGSWAALFSPIGGALSNQAPWLVWLLVLELTGLAMFALLFRLLPSLPDRGFALAKTLGLLLVAYGAWLLGSFRLLPFTPGSVWLCAGALVGGGGLAGWRSRAAIRAFVRQRRAALIAAEGLFLLAFFGFVLIRSLNPDLWHPARGGEKPMDLAFLTAVLKSGAFPPYDPWFAGGYINYYYFGFVFVGALVHLTGVAPATAYNLAVPTLFALTALGAWAVAYNLIAPRNQIAQETRRQGAKETSQPGGSLSPGLLVSRSARRGLQERRAIVIGLLAAAFVVLLGPLTQTLWYLPGSATPPFPGLPAECQLSSYAAQQQCRGRAEWAFWDATRLVGMDLQDSTITEFPFFTFLFADLHAHMIALPLALAALGLMVALIRGQGAGARGRGAHSQSLIPGPRRLAPVVLLALVVGALRATNTWDYPIYLGLSVATLALVAWRRLRLGATLPRTALFWAAASIGLLLGSSLLFLPFTRSFATDYAGLELWRGSHTLAADFLKIDGVWLFMLLSGALLLYRRRGAGLVRLALIGGGALVLAGAAVVLQASALVLLVPLAIAAGPLLFDMLLGPARTDGQPLATVQELQSDQDAQLALPTADVDLSHDVVYHRRGVLGSRQSGLWVSATTLLPVLWALAAIAIALAIELVVAKGDVGRMNTVFKFGMQSWVLFALPAALAIGALWPAGSRKGSDRKGRPHMWWIWRGAAALLVGAALVYPLTATPARIADRIDPDIGPTLDGIAFMRSDKGSWSENDKAFSFAQDAAAIDWMRANVAGTPIVLEAHTEAYRWGGRVSIYTGLPTLLGWPWHETQQRSVADVGAVLAGRQSLIQKLYSTTDRDEALRLLRLYGVEYVYLGQLERALYDPAGLAKFDALADAGQIQQVYSAGDTRIYRVPRAPGDAPPAVLTTSLPVRAPNLLPQKDTRLSRPVDQLPAVGEYVWNRLARSQPVAVLLWLLACYALLALGLPPTALVFGRGGRSAAPGDGGYAWARLVGLLLLGYAVWLPVSLGLWSYNRWGILWGALLVLALDAAIIAWLGRTADDRRPTTDDGEGLDGDSRSPRRPVAPSRLHTGARRAARSPAGPRPPDPAGRGAVPGRVRVYGGAARAQPRSVAADLGRREAV